MKNIFRGHTQDGSHWIFDNEEQFNELIVLLKHFRRKILFDEVYDSKFNAISLWCDGAAIGKYNPKCMGVFAITYEYYHPFYERLINENGGRYEKN